jgi:soluble lytic murein transglycosylase-like protein
MDNSFFNSQVQSILSQLMLTLVNNASKSTGGAPKATWIHAGDKADETGASTGAGASGSSKFFDIIEAAAEKYDVDAKLISSVIKAESNFNPRAVSSAGASGLMQLMPATAAGLGVQDPFDPEQNIMGGAKLLHRLLTKYDGNTQLALAAYNAGPGAVDRYGGIPPYRETQTYVSRVMQYYQSNRIWSA